MKKDILKNRKLLILIASIIILSLINLNVKQQTIAPSCFSKEDCKVHIKTGYCDVRYDCIVGKCYSEDIKCPEFCSGGLDEDMDGLIDCNDQDCFNSIWCPCELSDFSKCKGESCYCESGEPSWFVHDDTSNSCRCIQ